MRRLFLRNDWNGFPLRKDDDPEKENPLLMTNEETLDTTVEVEHDEEGNRVTRSTCSSVRTSMWST